MKMHTLFSEHLHLLHFIVILIIMKQMQIFEYFFTSLSQLFTIAFFTFVIAEHPNIWIALFIIMSAACHCVFHPFEVTSQYLCLIFIAVLYWWYFLVKSICLLLLSFHIL